MATETEQALIDAQIFGDPKETISQAIGNMLMNPMGGMVNVVPGVTYQSVPAWGRQHYQDFGRAEGRVLPAGGYGSYVQSYPDLAEVYEAQREGMGGAGQLAPWEGPNKLLRKIPGTGELERQRNMLDVLVAGGDLTAPAGYRSSVPYEGNVPGHAFGADMYGYQAGLKRALAEQFPVGGALYNISNLRGTPGILGEIKESEAERALRGYRHPREVFDGFLRTTPFEGIFPGGAPTSLLPEQPSPYGNLGYEPISHTDSGVGGDEIPTTVDVMPVISPPTDFRSNMPVIGPYAEPVDVDLTVGDILREQYNPRFVDAQELIPEITPEVFDDFVTEAILGIDKPSEVEDFSAIQERADQERAERERAQVRADNQRRENEAREAQDRARQDREKQERQARERKQEAKDRENRIREESRKAKEAQLQADDRKAIARARADAERAEREAEKARAKERQATIQRQEDVRRRQASERAAKQAEQARKAAIAAAKPTPVRRRRGGAPASRRVWTQPSRGRGR